MPDRRTFEAQASESGRRALRVCHLVYSFYENDNRVIRYAEALAARGARVDVLALRRSDQCRTERVGRVQVTRLQTRSVDERRAIDYLLKLLVFFVRAAAVLSWRQIRYRYDVVHVHNVPDFLVFAAILPRMLGARVILDIHDILPELFAGKFGSGADSGQPSAGQPSWAFRILLRMERLSCSFAHHVIVANHLWHDRLAARTSSVGKCTTIINYPDLELFTLARKALREERFIVLYPGTLNRHQGVDLAVQAFARVADQMAGAEFHIYGEGPAKADLESLIEQLGMSSRVLLKARVPLLQVPALMAQASVGIVPKRADGFGNEAFSTKILEFMACGVPVIVSRTRVDCHYFDDTLVRFFTPGDVDDLADALLWTYQSRATHDAWVGRARAFATEMGWQNRSKDYHSILNRLTGRLGSSSGDGQPMDPDPFNAR